MVDHGLEDQGRLVLGENQVVDSGNVTDWNVDNNRGLNGPSGSTIDTTHFKKIITTYGLDVLEERLYYYMKLELNKTNRLEPATLCAVMEMWDRLDLIIRSKAWVTTN